MIVDITLTLRGQSFEWDAEKAASNFAKHGVAFPEACEVFFDPFFHLVDATAGEEVREAAIGYTENARLLFVVHLMRAEEPSESFLHGPLQRKRGSSMSVNKRLKRRLLKDRPMTSISIRMPEDVLDDLKEIAPGLGFSGYQALIRFYIGQSLRKDLARKESGPVAIMAESLRRHGVSDAVIEEAVAEAMTKNP
jgi:uncharacterized DUF497 family protein